MFSGSQSLSPHADCSLSLFHQNWAAKSSSQSQCGQSSDFSGSPFIWHLDVLSICSQPFCLGKFSCLRSPPACFSSASLTSYSQPQQVHAAPASAVGWLLSLPVSHQLRWTAFSLSTDAGDREMREKAPLPRLLCWEESGAISDGVECSLRALEAVG